MDYSFQIAARDLLFSISHRQDSTYYSLYYTSRGALIGTSNESAMRDQFDDLLHHEQMFYQKATSYSLVYEELRQFYPITTQP